MGNSVWLEQEQEQEQEQDFGFGFRDFRFGFQDFRFGLDFGIGFRAYQPTKASSPMELRATALLRRMPTKHQCWVGLCQSNTSVQLSDVLMRSASDPQTLRAFAYHNHHIYRADQYNIPGVVPITCSSAYYKGRYPVPGCPWPFSWGSGGRLANVAGRRR